MQQCLSGGNFYMYIVYAKTSTKQSNNISVYIFHILKIFKYQKCLYFKCFLMMFYHSIIYTICIFVLFYHMS